MIIFSSRMVDKKFYNCVLSQVFSPCGDLLLCGNVYGDIAVFNISSVLRGDGESNKYPKFMFRSPNEEQICSMASSDRFLITGTVGAIFGWEWESVKEFKPVVAWTINIPVSNEKLRKTDINSIIVNKSEDQSFLYAGCGDNLIYAMSLEDGKILRKFSGHTDYVHSVANVGKILASASEDGSVRLWDFRIGGMTNVINPGEESKLTRPHLGKWVGDVDVTEDWLVCGGGPSLSLWHMRTMGLMSKLGETSDSGIHVSRLQEGWVLAGGTDSHFYQFSYTGDLLSKLHTTPSTVYSALFMDSPNEVLSLCGSGGEIDICTNFTYRHQVLSFFS